MTAAHTSRRATPRQTGLKSLAGVLTPVCVVLFLLAIEQKHAVQAWATVRDGAGPAARRVAGWATSGAEDGVQRLARAAEGEDPPMAATPQDRLLAGEFTPIDEATRQAVGGVAFVGARIQFENGETLHTRPLRIATGGEAYGTDGQTYADRFDAPRDAQVEIRQVVSPGGKRTVPASSLCGGQTPGQVALVHRQNRVDVMIFRVQTTEAGGGAVCGAWSFVGR